MIRSQLSADDSSAPAGKDVRILAEIVRRHFGRRPRQVRARHGGLTNVVLEFKVKDDGFILRMHADATKIGDYHKEQWAMEAARRVGIPVPKILEVANLPDGRAYMIAEQVPGIPGHRAPNRPALLKTLGQVAARLHTIRTHGYGPVFDWSSNELSRHARWSDYWSDGFKVERRLALLARHRMLRRDQVARLEATAARVKTWKTAPVLHHGDLRLKNTIVDSSDGRLLAVLDWEGCISSPGPCWDLSLALHDLGPDQKEAFLTGYGLDARRYEKLVPVLRLMNVLNYSGAVEHAARRKDAIGMAWIRLRLRGDLDLYEH